MILRTIILAGLLATGVSANATDFRMKIDRIDELNGIVLRGVSITETAEEGCISHDDVFVVRRNGKEVLQAVARILLVEDLREGEEVDGEAYAGEVISFYLPDMKKEVVQLGDFVTAKATKCKKSKRR